MIYKLPNGKPTEDIEEHGKAWEELYSKAEKHFPGFRCSGYDPKIYMAPIDPNPFKDDSFVLPVAAVIALK